MAGTRGAIGAVGATLGAVVIGMLGAACADRAGPPSKEDREQQADVAAQRGGARMSDDEEQWVQTLADSAKHSDQRRMALVRLVGAKFSDATLGGHAAEYVVALRSASTNGDLDLRLRALQDLCGARKDRDAQKRLIEGLEDPSKELCPPHEALRLLNYDVHAGVFPVAREHAVKKGPDERAQRAAVRILQQDPGSVDVLAQVLEDAASDEEARFLAGSGLRSLAPERFVASAKKVMVASADTEDMRAYVLEHVLRLDTSPEDLELRGAAEQVLADDKATDVMKRHARALVAKTPGPERTKQ